MAIPLIAAGALALVGLGVGAAGYSSGKEDAQKAEELRELINKLDEISFAYLEHTRNLANDRLEHLGSLKVNIYSGVIGRVTESLSNCTEFQGEYEGYKDFSEYINALKNLSSTFADIGLGIGVGALVGGLAALGAYGGVGMFAATASGTAISALSGVAATNATLAWLGGGSLAAGGLGMTAGAAALGGIVAGPVLAITGLFYASSKAKELEQVKKSYESLPTTLKDRFEVTKRLEALKKYVNYLINEAVNLQGKLELSFQKYENSKNDENLESMMNDLNALHKLLSTNIFDEDGKMTSGVDEFCSSAVFDENKDYIEQITKLINDDLEKDFKNFVELKEKLSGLNEKTFEILDDLKPVLYDKQDYKSEKIEKAKITSKSIFEKLYKDKINLLNSSMALNLIKSKITNTNKFLKYYVDKYGDDYRSFDSDSKKLVNDSFVVFTKLNRLLAIKLFVPADDNLFSGFSSFSDIFGKNEEEKKEENKDDLILAILGEEKTKLLKKIDLKEKK